MSLRTLLLLACMLGCAQGVSISDSVEIEEPGPELVPVSEELGCQMTFSPDRHSEAAVEIAVERWSSATGCNVQIASTGIAVFAVAEILTPEGAKARGATHLIENCEAGYIRITMNSIENIAVVTHEIGHALAGACNKEEAHTSTGVMRASIVDDCIDDASLTVVCGGLDCQWFKPEC